MKTIPLTPYQDVNQILEVFLFDVQEILRNQFLGMYLFGSLANGDFDRYSDIDVLVVTNSEISENQCWKLQSMHAKIAAMDNWYSDQLEVSYIPEEALRRFDPSRNQHLHLDRGHGEVLHIMQHDRDWVVQRYILRERGITLAGPESKMLIDPVTADDLREAMQFVLFGWYAHFLNKPKPFGSRGYQSYTVLSLCRILYTLQKGDVISKVAAAQWAKATLDTRWTPLIERALIGRQNSGMNPEPEDVLETLNMIQYAIDLAKPTPYPDVNQVLNLLLSNVKQVLGDEFIGMYLYGSLSNGDFDPQTSDIDFLVVTTDVLPEEKINQLEEMHKQTWAASLQRAGELEGAYVPRALIRRHDPRGTACPTVNEGRFYVAPLGSDWMIQRHVVREYGVIVEGPDPKALIDSVSPDRIRSAIIGILHEWWFPMLEDPAWLRDHGSKYHAFAVITMCRVLHGLEHGTITSKPKAVAWAQEKLGEPWAELVKKAVAASQYDEHSDFLGETLDFIRFVKEQVINYESIG